MVNNTSKIVRKEILSNKYILFKLDVGKEFKYIPGQYLIFIFENNLRRSYSIASCKDGILDICIKIDEGLGAQLSLKLNEGDTINFIGPVGTFNLHEDSKSKIFIATGVGITPIRSMIEYIKDKESNFKLFWGVRNKDDFIFDFSYLGNKYIQVVSGKDETFERKGHVNEYLLDNLEDKNVSFYICGNSFIVTDIKRYIIENMDFVTPEYIYTEKF